jgi:hypothetical protein
VAGAGLGAALQGAVDAVPAGHAEAGPVLALAVEAAAEVAASVLAARSGPPVGADAGRVLAPEVDLMNQFGP